MDIFNNLVQEHQEIIELLEKLEDETLPVTQGVSTFYTVAVKLISHAKAEYVTVYSRMSEDEEAEEVAMQADHEHILVEKILQEMMATNMNSDLWRSKLTALKDNVIHHIEEEEGPLFTEVKKILHDGEAESLGEDYSIEKEKLEKELEQTLVQTSIISRE
jgi:L-cysteine desulfidase